jgi:ParB family chromosome partitioning protein
MGTMLEKQQNTKQVKMDALRQFSQTGKFTV